MSLVVYIFIMQIDLISRIMVLTGLAFFSYHGWQFIKVWWDSLVGEPVWSEFWKKRRKKASVAGIILLIGMALPSRTEALAQYAGWRLANASVWDRLFADKASFEDTLGRFVNQGRK